ncbi:MAG: ABC transporter ATP-binding protein, partial [Clostridiales bacterium]|nr:ABC transporter ATP-binding protein [Clostridiales bacterium]
MNEPILRLDNLHTAFHTKAGEVQAVRGVSFDVAQGEIVGVVGESGCGKSVTAASILRVLPENAWHSEGKILFLGEDLLSLSKSRMRAVRGRQISMIFQDPMTSLSPLMRIGRQIEEAILQSGDGVTRAQARERALEMLHRVHIPDPESRYNCYPHELSGGMRQRVMIAIALSCRPRLVIADEPTTALDVTVQAQVLELLQELQEELDTSILLITHNLGVVWKMCDYVMVMYAGKTVEYADAKRLYDNPLHPYTWGLLDSMPKLS